MTQRLALFFIFALVCAAAFVGGRALAGSLERPLEETASRSHPAAARTGASSQLPRAASTRVPAGSRSGSANGR